MTTETPIKIQIVKSLSTAQPSRIVAVKADGESSFKLFVTDKTGLPYPLDADGTNSTIITNSDNNLDIVNGTLSTNINLSSSILSVINSALQSGDNISELLNDAGYITAADVEAVNLVYIASPTDGVVQNSAGSDATIPLADTTNAGLLSPNEKANIASAIQPDDLATVAITGEYEDLLNTPQTKVEFNSELTDGNFLFEGDITQYTDELAQDAVGGILANTTTIDLSYNDGSNSIFADIKSNSIDATHLSNSINISEFTNDSGYVADLRNINTASPLLGGGNLTVDRTLSIQQSTSTQDGYLSAVDWNTFNSKQNNIGYISENISNKSDSFTISSSTTYASTKALIDGLATKLDDTDFKTIEGQSIVGSGNIDITKADVGLGNVDNTSDLNKPISTATQTALNTKQNTISGTTNVIPKFGVGGLVTSNLSDNGTTVNSSTDMIINGLIAGRSAGSTTGNVRFSSNGLSLNTTGIRLSSFGDGALQFNSTGIDNVGFASNALRYNTIGSNNVAIGSNAGVQTPAFQNITKVENSVFIGVNIRGSSVDSGVNEIVIGNTGVSLGSNTTVIGNSSTQYGRWWGNLLLGTSTNNGRRLQVIGGADVDNLKLTTTPTTSAGAYRLLTYNETSDAVESIPSNTYAATASPAFTGTPTAPTPTAGTNTTQIATTAFVLANAGGTPQDLQSVIDNGGYAEVDGGNSFAEMFSGVENERRVDIYTSNSEFGDDKASSLTIENERVELFNSENVFGLYKNGILTIEGGDVKILQYSDPFTTNVSFNTPIVDSEIKIPAPTVAGIYTLATTDQLRPYKVYTALINQTGTSAPTVTVLENTLGGSIVWSYNSTGSFTGTRASAFTNLKTAFFSTPSVGTDVTIGLARMNDNEIELTTTQSGGLTNGLLNFATIEIRVYN